MPIAIALAMIAAGCASDAASSSSTSATTSPTAPATTESFSGSLVQLGSASNPFIVAATGTVTIGLTDIGPLTTMALGVGIGTWNGTTCSSALTKNDNARAGATALSGTATAGNYCVTVYDSGNIPDGQTVTFTVSVAHS